VSLKQEYSREQRLTKFGAWLLAGAFFALPLNALRPVDALSYGDLLLLLAAGVAALVVVFRRQLPEVPAWLWGGAVLLLISALLPQVFPPASVAPLKASFPDVLDQSAFVSALKLLFGAAALPVVVATLARDWRSISLLVSAWIAGVAFSCAVAVSDAYIGTDFQLALTYDLVSVVGFFVIEPARSIGLTVHSNALSLTAVMVTPLVIARMTDFRRVLYFYPLFLLLLVGILLSGARAGLVGILLAVVLTLVASPQVRSVLLGRDYRVVLTLGGGLIATAALVLGLSIQPSSRAADFYADQQASTGAGLLASVSARPLTDVLLASSTDEDAPPTISRFGGGDESAAVSDGLRRQYLEDSATYISERPFLGYGFRWVETSHNIYLQLLLSGGILALVGFLTIASGYVRAGYRLRSSVPEPHRTMASAALVSFILVLITGMVSNSILDRYLYLPAGLIFAMSMISKRARAAPDAPPDRSPLATGADS
jgi:hypothetical protein